MLIPTEHKFLSLSPCFSLPLPTSLSLLLPFFSPRSTLNLWCVPRSCVGIGREGSWGGVNTEINETRCLSRGDQEAEALMNSFYRRAPISQLSPANITSRSDPPSSSQPATSPLQPPPPPPPTGPSQLSLVLHTHIPQMICVDPLYTISLTGVKKVVLNSIGEVRRTQ